MATGFLVRAAGPLLERGVVMVGSARLLITAKAFCVQHGFVSASLNTGAQAAPVPAAESHSAMYLIDHCATSVWLPHAFAGPRCRVPFARQVSGVDCATQINPAPRRSIDHELDGYWRLGGQRVAASVFTDR